MNQTDLNILKGYCQTFKEYRSNTVDGNGNNLHDIKVTFDFVKKTAENYSLQGTTFGDSLIKKVTDASDVLSQLWTCLNNLEISITTFVSEQEKSNKKF